MSQSILQLVQPARLSPSTREDLISRLQRAITALSEDKIEGLFLVYKEEDDYATLRVTRKKDFYAAVALLAQMAFAEELE